jgi:protocatechuate 3,4-dioxygenase beta subunit
MRRTSLIRGLALCASLVLSHLVTRLAVAQPELETKSVKLTVAGRVVDARGNPVAAARVVLRDWPDLRYGANPRQQLASDILAETKTDIEGRFRFENVPAATIVRYSFAPAPWDLIAFANGHGLAFAHLGQTEAERADVTLTLPPAKAIDGRLTDGSGSPIANCKVEVQAIAPPLSEESYSLNDPNHLSLFRSAIAPTTKTGADGRFEIAGMPAGQRVTLVLTEPRFAREYIYVATTDEPAPPVTSYVVNADGTQKRETRPVHNSGFTLALKPGGQVRGRVVYADTGAPAQRMNVTSGPSDFQLTDTDGRFTFTSIAQSKVDVQVWPEGEYLNARQSIEFTPEKREHELTIPLPRGIAVRGTVVDSDTGAGVPKVNVQYVPAGAKSEDFNEWSPARDSVTGADGRFELFAPPGPGTVRLGAMDVHATHNVPVYYRWREGRVDARYSTQIDVKPAAPVEGLRFTVGRGIVLRGRAVDMAGQPVAGADVKSAGRIDGIQPDPNLKTDDDGRFEFSRLEGPGPFAIRVSHAERKLSGGARVDVPPGAGLTHVVDVEPVRMLGAAEVTGIVLVDGQPRAGVTVTSQVLIAMPERQGSYMTESVQSVTTGPDGKFKLQAPAEQDFMVSVYQQGISNRNSPTQNLRAGQTFELPPFELQSLDAFVEGIVVDPDGNPVPGVQVQATAMDAQRRYLGGGSSEQSGPDGRFRITNLPKSARLEIMAYQPSTDRRGGGRLLFPARTTAETGQTDARVVFDPKLKRTLPTEPRSSASNK